MFKSHVKIFKINFSKTEIVYLGVYRGGGGHKPITILPRDNPLTHEKYISTVLYHVPSHYQLVLCRRSGGSRGLLIIVLLQEIQRDGSEKERDCSGSRH